jgi:hypothetical protein
MFISPPDSKLIDNAFSSRGDYNEQITVRRNANALRSTLTLCLGKHRVRNLRPSDAITRIFPSDSFSKRNWSLFLFASAAHSADEVKYMTFCYGGYLDKAVGLAQLNYLSPFDLEAAEQGNIRRFPSHVNRVAEIVSMNHRTSR